MSVFRAPNLLANTYVALNASLVDDFIDIVGGDTGLQLPRSNIKDLSRHPAHLAHTVLLRLVQKSDIVSANKFLLGAGNAIFRVVRVRNRLRDSLLRRQRVNRSEGSGESEGRKRIVFPGCWVWFRNYFWREKVGEEITLFVESFVITLREDISIQRPRGMRAVSVKLSAYPASFETVLRAEEAVQAHLQTCWALQRAGVFGTFGAETLSWSDFSCHVIRRSIRWI